MSRVWEVKLPWTKSLSIRRWEFLLKWLNVISWCSSVNHSTEILEIPIVNHLRGSFHLQKHKTPDVSLWVDKPKIKYLPKQILFYQEANIVQDLHHGHSTVCELPRMVLSRLIWLCGFLEILELVAKLIVHREMDSFSTRLFHVYKWIRFEHGFKLLITVSIKLFYEDAALCLGRLQLRFEHYQGSSVEILYSALFNWRMSKFSEGSQVQKTLQHDLSS